MMSETSQTLLLLLQGFQVAFLWLHDWVPPGRLNDVAAVRRQDARWQLLLVTFAFGCAQP